jgi:hypothetical protein
MDSGSLVLNGVAIAISLLALVISGVLSARQLRSMKHANSVPVAIEMLTREFDRDDFQRKESLVLHELPDHDISLGVSGLPEPLRSAVFSVSFFYDSMAIMVAFGFVGQDLVLSTINYRIRRIWYVMEGHILGERALRDAPFLNFLEDLAYRAHAYDPRDSHKRLRLHSMPRSTPIGANLVK